MLITAGPTYERIDPVRFIGNFSSGKMGFALAQAFEQMGATVTLVAGPVAQKTPEGNINRINVESAREMETQVKKCFPQTNILVMSAAVADFAPNEPQKDKIKKKDDFQTLSLKKTTDILSMAGKMKKPGQTLVGFALETANELENAREKLHEKKLDMIVLNSLNDPGAGFGTDTNKVTLITQNRMENWPLKTKVELAQDMAHFIVDKLILEPI